MKNTTPKNYVTTIDLYLTEDGTVGDKNDGYSKLITAGTVLTEVDDDAKTTDQIVICDAELADGTQILDAFKLTWIAEL